jgi:hypothetical protein
MLPKEPRYVDFFSIFTDIFRDNFYSRKMQVTAAKAVLKRPLSFAVFPKEPR